MAERPAAGRGREHRDRSLVEAVVDDILIAQG
jgi:hypothetical protein